MVYIYNIHTILYIYIVIVIHSIYIIICIVNSDIYYYISLSYITIFWLLLWCTHIGSSLHIIRVIFGRTLVAQVVPLVAAMQGDQGDRGKALKHLRFLAKKPEAPSILGNKFVTVQAFCNKLRIEDSLEKKTLRLSLRFFLQFCHWNYYFK